MLIMHTGLYKVSYIDIANYAEFYIEIFTGRRAMSVTCYGIPASNYMMNIRRHINQCSTAL